MLLRNLWMMNENVIIAKAIKNESYVCPYMCVCLYSEHN